MLYDHRTYVCRPGTIKKHLELYKAHGLAPQTRNLGQPMFYAMTETGNPNAYIHIWVYEDAADRAKKRAAMQADPEWQEYLRLSSEAGFLESQMNTLMTPVDFFKK